MIVARAIILLIFASPGLGHAAIVGQPVLTRKVALVIGNQDYPGKGQGQRGAMWSELQAPVKDARKMAEKLSRSPLNFRVTLLVNQSRRDMKRALDKFYSEIDHADLALFYFSGHGFSSEGQSYLVPTDVLDRDISASQHAPKFIGVQQLAGEIRRRARYGLVFLDACRDESRGGFMRVEGIPPGNGQVIVSYAATLGTWANDARLGDNSPYTQAVLRHIAQPDLNILDLMIEIGKSLQAWTRGPESIKKPQSHEFVGGIRDAIYLAGMTDRKVKEIALSASLKEQEMWDTARLGRDRDAVWQYLRRYPDGHFAPAATVLLDDLEWAEARQKAKQGNSKSPIQQYIASHQKGGRHLKEAQDSLKPLWRKPSFWLSLGAGVLAASAVAIGVGVKATSNQPPEWEPRF